MAPASRPSAAARCISVRTSTSMSPGDTSETSILARRLCPRGVSSPLETTRPRGWYWGRRVPSAHILPRPDLFPCARSRRSALRCMRATSPVVPVGAKSSTARTASLSRKACFSRLLSVDSQLPGRLRPLNAAP